MSEAPSNKRFRLPRSRILRGKSNFACLFEHGATIKTPDIWFTYKTIPSTPSEFKIGFLARKRLGNAVIRNRLRRQMREQFRLLQYEFTSVFSSQGCGAHAFLSVRHPNVNSSMLRSSMLKILHELNSILKSKTPPRG
jgi:ribonuclease P protein component